MLLTAYYSVNTYVDREDSGKAEYMSKVEKIPYVTFSLKHSPALQ